MTAPAMRSLFRTLLAACLPLITTGTAQATVYLTSHVFAANNLPYVWTDEAIPAPYRLRVKIAGTHHATNLYNNNWTRLESVPAPGTYLVELYWVLYDPANWTVLREVGPFTRGTITIQPAGEPPYARSLTATPTSPGLATTLTGSAYDRNADLAWLHFFTNDPQWRGYVYAGSAYLGTRADATASLAWTVPAGSVTGTFQAHMRAADATGLWDWNGGANAAFSVRSAQPPVYSQNAAVVVGTAFTPWLGGGAGSGPWQWVVAGRTNWGGSQPGTLLPPNNAPALSWVPEAAGDYYFWVIRQGDASYLPSNIAGPYLLSVRAIPPAITIAPASLTVNAGQNAAITATASGSLPLSLQWYRNGNAIAGATNANLIIASTTTADSGLYHAVATNSAGSAASTYSKLEVISTPWSDADGDGVPDSIERLLGTNAALPATNDSANATLRLRIHQP